MVTLELIIDHLNISDEFENNVTTFKVKLALKLKKFV